MGSRLVRIEEDVYERIEASRRDDETFSEAIERLIRSPSLLSLRRTLTEGEEAEFREAVEDADAAAVEDVADVVDQFDDARRS